jgi:hypothetical protein
MARRQSLISNRKQRAPRVSRSEQYIVNYKYLGEEPLFDKVPSISEYSQALTWYNYMCTNEEARDYLKDYLKSNSRIEELKKLNRVPDSWISTTACWIARMITRGSKMPETSQVFLEIKIKDMLSRAKVEEPVVETEAKKLTVKERINEKASDIIGEIEEMIDSGVKFSLYDWLKSKATPSIYSSIIVKKYTPWLGELLEALGGNDNQLKEAYRYLSKKQLKELVLFFNSLIEDAERYGAVTKKTRNPRKPRAVSVEKKLKNLKYQKEDKEFKIASVNPEKIIGAQELWTFNTKYKTLTVLRAIDRGGLQIKGTSVLGYDENNSVTKRTGRRPEEYVKKVLEGGKIVLRKLMDELKKEASLAYRINENTILLKIT